MAYLIDFAEQTAGAPVRQNILNLTAPAGPPIEHHECAFKNAGLVPANALASANEMAPSGLAATRRKRRAARALYEWRVIRPEPCR